MEKETESIVRGVGATHIEPWRQTEPLDPDPEDEEEPPPLGRYEEPRGEQPD